MSWGWSLLPVWLPLLQSHGMHLWPSWRNQEGGTQREQHGLCVTQDDFFRQITQATSKIVQIAKQWCDNLSNVLRVEPANMELLP